MTGTDVARFTRQQSRWFLNHLVPLLWRQHYSSKASEYAAKYVGSAIAYSELLHACLTLS